MKKDYETPQLDIIKLNTASVITDSIDGPSGGDIGDVDDWFNTATTTAG